MQVKLFCAVVIAMALAFSTIAHSEPARLIVKLTADATKAASTPKARIDKLGAATGTALTHVREMALGADVVAVEGATQANAAAIAARLAADPDVEFADVDRRRHALQVAPVNDLYAPQQRYLRNDPTAISAYAAWDVTHGSSSIVVAVVDTGYRPHAALAGRFLPGYDMISDPAVAADGDGRDADAGDPGDFVTASEATDDCPAHNSTWHGTSVAGIIGANTNDGAWTAGIDWASKLLPVRVLGQCGGYDSDIADGIAWAAGLAVPGAPANPTPANVINLSLGGSGDCPAIYANVAAAAYAHGVTRAIVAAAGNAAGDVAGDSPANCPGFYAIASTTPSGGLASYSNFGAGIDLSAPGGTFNPRIAGSNVTVLSNRGLTTPGADSIASEGGTSFAAAMVSGTISLMLAVAPNLTPDQVHSLLVTSAKPFPDGSNCTTDKCGAGIVDAGAAVRAAAAAAASAPPRGDYEGLWWNAPAASESGWGINLAHQDDVIFATWFTYDASGKAWWLSMTAFRTAPNAFAGTLYETHGSAFSAVPFNPAAVTRASVGSGALTFSDDNNGTFAYTVNGIQQTKPITREVFGPMPTCAFGALADLAQATNYQDLWWAAPAGSESGWGINLTQQGDTIFATWFTYDVDGSPLWLSVTAGKSAPSVYTGTLIRTTGPAFNAVPFDPGQVGRNTVGTATFSFADGDAGTFAYTVNNVSQTRSIVREVLRAPGTVCQ
jgi:serine protease